MIRQLSRCVLESIQVSKETQNDVETIIAELCANVIVHARGNRFRVEIEYYKDRVAVNVIDGGDGFAPEAVPEPGTERESRQGKPRVGGFGLFLVQSMADHLEFLPVDPKGMMVRAEKKLFPASDAITESEIFNDKVLHAS